jgi:thioredoxin 1
MPTRATTALKELTRRRSRYCTPPHTGIDRAAKETMHSPKTMHPSTRDMTAEDIRLRPVVDPDDDSDPIQTVTSETFERLVLQGRGPIAVEFMSYGCAHCRAIEPFLQKAAEMLSSKEQIFRVNVAVDPDLANSYQITGTPTFIMFFEAREVGRVEGLRATLSGVVKAITQSFES